MNKLQEKVTKTLLCRDAMNSIVSHCSSIKDNNYNPYIVFSNTFWEVDNEIPFDIERGRCERDDEIEMCRRLGEVEDFIRNMKLNDLIYGVV